MGERKRQRKGQRGQGREREKVGEGLRSHAEGLHLQFLYFV